MSRDRPLIAHIIDSLDTSGGAEKQLIANLRSFDHDQMTHELVVLRSSPNSRFSEVPDDVSVELIFQSSDVGSRGSAIRRVVSLARDRRYDLIHGSLPNASLCARAVGRFTRTQAVESLVNISHERIRCVDNPHVTPAKLAMHTFLDRVTMRSLSALHAVSPAVASSWQKTVGIDPQKITVIPRGVDRSTLFSDAPRERRLSIRHGLGVQDNELLVLSVGRLEPQKGHRYLVEAAWRAAIDGLKVVIVGRKGNSTSALEALIERYGLNNQVVLAGSRHDIPDLLDAADIFAFPSLFEGNGGNAMIEAMAAGLAIVTTNEQPMTDLIPSEEFGMLVPRADSESLAEALRRLASSAPLRRKLGDAARQRTLEFPTPKQVASRFEEWYRSLLSQPDTGQ